MLDIIRFQVDGLIFLLIVGFFFLLRKKQVGNLENNSFGQLLLAAIANLVFDIVMLIMLEHRENVPVLCNVFAILYTISETFISFMYYRFIWSHVGRPRNVFGNAIMHYTPFGIAVLSCLIFETEIPDSTAAVYLGGVPVYAGYVMTGLYFIAAGVMLYIYRKRLTKTFRMTTAFILLMTTIIALLQAITQSHNLLGFGCAISCVILFVAIENPDLRLANRLSQANKDIGSEMVVSEKIQRALLPKLVKEFTEVNRYDIDADLRISPDFGGDFYDCYMVDDNRLALVIADVKGSGMAATILMVITKVMIKNEILCGKTPAEALMTVNRNIVRDNSENMSVSVFAAVIDLDENRMTFANAGMEQPIIKWADTSVSFLETNKNVRIGLSDETVYTDMYMTLEPGSVLLMYTDGLIERKNKRGDEYGSSRLFSAFETATADTSYEKFRNVINKVRNDMDVFASNSPITDDIAMLAVRMNADRQAPVNAQ